MEPPNSNAQIMALRHTTTHSLLPPSLFAVRQAGILGQNVARRGRLRQKKTPTNQTHHFVTPLAHSRPPLRKGVLIRSLVRSVQQISHLHVSLVLVVKFGRRFHSIPAFIIINAIGFSKGASHVSKRHVWGGRGDAAYQYVASLFLSRYHILSRLFSVSCSPTTPTLNGQ